MPLFLFHLRTDRGLDRDDVGTPFPDLDAAYLDVCRAIPDMVTGLLRDGDDPMRCTFEIADERDELLMEVPFAERLTRAVRRPRREEPSAPARCAMMDDLLGRAAAATAETRALLRLTEKTLAMFAPSSRPTSFTILDLIVRRYDLPAAEPGGIDTWPAMPGTVRGFKMPGAGEVPTA